jgi:hypothetical protein
MSTMLCTRVPASALSLSRCRRSSVSNHKDYRFSTGANVRMPFGCFLDLTKALARGPTTPILALTTGTPVVQGGPVSTGSAMLYRALNRPRFEMGGQA